MKRILSLILVAVMIVFTTVIGGAHYDIPEGMTLEEAAKDPKYWYQGVCPEGNFQISPGSSTVGGAACSWFSASFCLVKMGLMIPPKDNPIELIKWAQEDYVNRMIGYPQFHVEYNSLSQRYPGLETKYNDDLRGVCDYDKVKLYVKGKMSEKWFVAICVGQEYGGSDGAHWVAVDGFDKDGDIIIADSAYSGWNEPKKYNAQGCYGNYNSYAVNSVCHFALFRKDGADPNNCPSIYGGKFEGGDSTKLSDAEQEEYNKICEEYELKGLSGIVESNLLDGQKTLEFSDRRYLSQDKINQIENINDIQESSKPQIVTIVSIILRVIGILLILYSVLLLLCMMLDKVNNLFDFSFLTLVSLGTLKLNNESTLSSDLRKKNHKSIKTILIIIGIIFLLGLVFLSDIVLKVIYSIVG